MTEVQRVTLDTVMAHDANHRAHHCELIAINKTTVRLRNSEGHEGLFALSNGRPDKRAPNAVQFRGWYIHKGELPWLIKKAFEDGGGKRGGRHGVTSEIRDWLCLRCPVAGRWRMFTEVTVAADLDDEGPDAAELRVDVAFAETGMGRRTLAVEIKSNRHDFQADRKWEKYAGHFHGLAFAAPRDAVVLGDLPSKVGLYHWTGLGLECVRVPTFADQMGMRELVDTYRGMALAASRNMEGSL